MRGAHELVQTAPPAAAMPRHAPLHRRIVGGRGSATHFARPTRRPKLPGLWHHLDVEYRTRKCRDYCVVLIC